MQATELELQYTPQGHLEEIATYFREYTRKFMHDWIKENPKTDGTEYNIYSDGLKIFTTIDSKMQYYAEDAVSKHMSSLQKEFESQNKRNRTAPFRDVTKEEIANIFKFSNAKK